MTRPVKIPLKVAMAGLAVVEALPTWLYIRLPLWVEHPLLVSKHAAEDRRARLAYEASCERARLAWIAQREANGPGCPWCPNEHYAVLPATDAGDVYAECTECGATWFLHPCGDEPDNEGDDPMNEMDDDAMDAVLDEERAVRREEEEPPRPVEDHGFQPGDRVMWSHGRGIPGTVIPESEWPGNARPAPGTVCIVWDDGAELLMSPGTSIVPLTAEGPVPYPDDWQPATLGKNEPPF